MKKIIYTDRGIANHYEDYIEINRVFNRYPKLKRYILRHEKGHKEGFDLLHEFDLKVPLLSLGWAILKHPSTWVDFLPIQYKDKRIIYDKNVMALYFIILLVLMCGWLFYQIFIY